MSTIVSSCVDNGSSHNPISHLSNRFFQDASIATTSSPRTLLSNTEQGKRNTSTSFRSCSTSTPESEWLNGDNGEWNNLFQQNVVHGRDHYSKDDEHFTEIYIKQNGLHDNIRTRRHSFSSSQKNSFVQEFLHNSSNDNVNYNQQSITIYTNHCDLFQAQIYLLDHLFSTILSYPITSTYRPSPTTEWNWNRLFSPTRWCDKEEGENDDDKSLRNELLKNVAIRRLQLLLGHLIVCTDNENTNKQKEESEWGWEWEFYNS
ncbi:18932_t:CDS:2 [Funneliformis geosporum]|uniref:16295_t:CDS:1 n=1 Tax=Funneliformis geosporum TaxID=1117311 RepID=A0A9W4SM79_9GLOM|nr:16295_t:CDS:2 [Funneliformis geosporum]CAI2175879.1 18932_t:CDS:2 [Funneliformis geosporum]